MAGGKAQEGAMAMEQYWKRLERHLTEQREKDGKIDSVVDVAVEGR